MTAIHCAIAIPVLGLAACGFTPGAAAIVDGNATDGKAPDAPLGASCYGPSGWSVCLPSPPSGAIPIDGALDTDASPLCSPTQLWLGSGQPASCFIVGDSIVVGTVTAHGSRPLVLVAATTITINSLLDVSSHRTPTNVGPGSSTCMSFQQSPGFSGGGSGGGGGAGGSFMTQGGDGGAGEGGQSQNGMAAAAYGSSPSRLRTGCTGQTGAGGAVAGSGGGAIYLVAATSITGGGAIDASGAGASAGGVHGGGGGGGSGGMIVMAAPIISVATVMANGGGGASGGNDGGGGQPGSDPSVGSPTVQAPGGGSGGRSGGAGYANNQNAASGTDGPGSGDAGGGGGGGAGSILATATPTGTVSPPPASLP